MTNKIILSAVTAALIGFTGTAGAVTTSTLAALSDGGSLSIGDKVFSGFNFQADGLTSFNAANINVTASIGTDGVYYLTWSGNMTLSTLASAAPVSADLKLNYIVTATAGQIHMIDQSYTGGMTGGRGSLSIAETVATGSFGGPIVANSHLDLNDMSDPSAEVGGQNIVGDNLNVDPAQSVLYVTKDINFSAISLGDLATVTVSQVSQSFHQTAVPDGGMTLALLGAGISGLAFFKRKINA